ncbi:MAG TPA: type 1 glutamine amidotransferase [Mycobacteriales bacterium]|nr:type 1 glutamine amidotransferase [Mycobacteriales bacterium]
MRSALVIQHAEVEGVGRFADWFPQCGLELRVVHPYDGEALPAAVDADALIVMGGPMGAYDDADSPWLPATKLLLADAVRRGVPTLGICLGAQLLAVATGGKVERGAAGPELGLAEVTVATPDRLFEAGPMPVAQWHYDTVTELPPGATLLASSDRYPTQAFRVGDSAWGLQFHIEATPGLVGTWAHAEQCDVVAIVEPLVSADAAISRAGEQVARRFAAVVTG